MVTKSQLSSCDSHTLATTPLLMPTNDDDCHRSDDDGVPVQRNNSAASPRSRIHATTTTTLHHHHSSSGDELEEELNHHHHNDNIGRPWEEGITSVMSSCCCCCSIETCCSCLSRPPRQRRYRPLDPDSQQQPVVVLEEEGDIDRSSDDDNCYSVTRGLLYITGIGILLGLVSIAWTTWLSSESSSKQRQQHDVSTKFWSYPTLSICIGYIYFCMWSISFYPQILLNYTRQTTSGLSMDFACLNVIGFLCYTIYNVNLYANPMIRKEYYSRHHDSDSDSTQQPQPHIPVELNDVAFAIHALILSSVTLFQIGYYDILPLVRRRHEHDDNNYHHEGERSNHSAATPNPAVIARRLPSKLVALVVVVVLIVIVGYPIGRWLGANWMTSRLSPLDYIYVLSYIKMGITFIKYIPQVVLNIQRQSTVGWNIQQIILDFSGGLCSLVQLVLDCYRVNDWSGITGNLAKFALGLISIGFDILFLFQHYVLYNKSSTTNPRQQEHTSDGMDNATVVEGCNENTTTAVAHHDTATTTLQNDINDNSNNNHNENMRLL